MFSLVAFAGVAMATTAAAPAALVARYDFNDQNTTTATDSAGTAQNGAINGGATYAASPVGAPGTNYGLVLDGANDYVAYVNNTGTDATLSQSVTASGKYTIEAWVNNLVTIDGAEPQIFGQDTSTIGITSYRGSSYGYVMAGANNVSTAVGAGYHHLVVTYDPTLADNQFNYYLDGALVSSKDFALPPTLAPSQTVEYRTGRGGPGDPNSYLQGFIDEIRYHDEALSSATVAANFAAGPTLVPEPASLGIACAGGIALVARGRRRCCRAVG